MKVVLKVRHRGVAKMTGKIFPVIGTAQGGTRTLVFLHEALSNQWHRNTDSPGGVDEGVLEWLEATRVEEFHHFNRDTRELFRLRVAAIRDNGIWQRSDGRIRCYVPRQFWTPSPSAPLPYVVPWINDEKIVEAIGRSASEAGATTAKPKRETRKKASASTCTAQAALFEVGVADISVPTGYGND